jgi:hypothetical protein
MMLGFISFRHYTSDDGEMLAVVEFALAASLDEVYFLIQPG